ncbi:hypothetical protein LJB42_002684 [Komagataella kurtzmanii]|nr:hypothetical protein LJB42_002684 [Komagataella kurtzmanii]
MLFLWLLLPAAFAHQLSGRIEIDDVDSSRTKVELYSPNVTITTRILHDGTFTISDPPTGTYKLSLQLQDYALKNDRYRVEVTNENIIAHKYVTNQNWTESGSLVELPLFVPFENVVARKYIEISSGGILANNSWIIWAQQNPLMALGVLVTAAIGLFPHVMNYFDPGFTKRILEETVQPKPESPEDANRSANNRSISSNSNESTTTARGSSQKPIRKRK